MITYSNNMRRFPEAGHEWVNIVRRMWFRLEAVHSLNIRRGLNTLHVTQPEENAPYSWVKNWCSVGVNYLYKPVCCISSIRPRPRSMHPFPFRYVFLLIISVHTIFTAPSIRFNNAGSEYFFAKFAPAFSKVWMNIIPYNKLTTEGLFLRAFISQIFREVRYSDVSLVNMHFYEAYMSIHLSASFGSLHLGSQ